MRYRFGLTIARSCIADVRIDRFLCGKTLMKKTYCIGGSYLGYQTAVGDMVLETVRVTR